MTIIYFLLTIVILVGIHEFGHFLAARAFGVYVHEFSIGMGPILASRKKGETLYAVRWIPIGGYVRMAGEDRLEAGGAIPADRVLHNKPPYVRIVISLAGPLMNAVLSLVVILAMSLSMSLPILQVVGTVPGSPAEGRFQPGDRILAIGGTQIYTTTDLTRAIQRSGGEPLDFQIRRDRVEETVSVRPARTTDGAGYEVGISFWVKAETSEIVSLSAASPLYVAGVQRGDRIVWVGGEKIATRDELMTALEAAFQVSDAATISVARNGETVDITLRSGGRPVSDILANAQFGNLGVDYHRPGLRAGLALGLKDFATYATLLAKTLRDIAAGSPEARAAVAGPVGIAQVIGQSLAYGFAALVQILGFLSLNFAIINLIPFPGLDGSRVVFAIIEWIRRKPIPPQKEGLIHAIGFVVMLVLLIVITYRDIIRILG